MDGPGARPTSAGAEFGKYTIVGKLGSGTHGVVYEATMSGPMGFAKRVALKVLRSQVVAGDDFVRSMVNEARIGGFLQHPNIVNVLEFDEVGGVYFLCTELVDGATLMAILDQCRHEGTDLPASAVLDLMEQVCKGLHYAHTFVGPDGQQLRLVHRDIKPSNILIDRQGIARIMDFGIAKAASNLFQTTIGGAVIRGTPQYISPEQILGESDLTPATDVFALGVVLYELVTMEPLFRSRKLEDLFRMVLEADVTEELAVAEARLPGVRSILARALHKDAASRYQDARSMAADIRHLAQQQDFSADTDAIVAGLIARCAERETDDITDRDALDEDLARETDRYERNLAKIVGTDDYEPVTDGAHRPAAGVDPVTGELDEEETGSRRGGAFAVIGIVGCVGLVLVGMFLLAAGVAGVGLMANRGASVDSQGVQVDVVEVEADPVVDTAVDADSDVDAVDVAQTDTDAPPDEIAPTDAVVAPIDTGVALLESSGEPAFLSVNTRPWATVYLDGEYIGNTPMKEFEITPGSHTVRLECGSCITPQKRVHTFDVASGELYTQVYEEFAP
jgi:serine/threonine protein kinase